MKALLLRWPLNANIIVTPPHPLDSFVLRASSSCPIIVIIHDVLNHSLRLPPPLECLATSSTSSSSSASSIQTRETQIVAASPRPLLFIAGNSASLSASLVVGFLRRSGNIILSQEEDRVLKYHILLLSLTCQRPMVSQIPLSLHGDVRRSPRTGFCFFSSSNEFSFITKHLIFARG